jgi:hypothetical protein
MSWRPAGWSNPYPKTIIDECSGIEVDSDKYPIFEAGGDAMLEALRKRGRGLHLPGNVPTDNAEGLVRIPLALKNVPQTIVIIPDDTEKVKP